MRHEIVDIPANGVRLRADDRGDRDAPPVILLHGGGQTRHAWDETAVALAERGWRSLAVDQRGHGESQWAPDGGYDAGDFAADLRDVVTYAGGTPAIVGASLGGMASLLALGAPSPPEGPGPVPAAGLVVVDVGHRIEAAGVERITWFMRGAPDGFASLEEVADAVAAYNPHRPRPTDLSGLRKNLRQRDDGRWIWHWDPRFLDQRSDRAPADPVEHNRPRLAAAAQRIQVPTLIVRGLVSDLLSPAGVRELQELIPGSELVEVDGAGHMVAGDRNNLFNDAVISFLDPILQSLPTAADN